MENEAVQFFNKMLYSMYDARPPISKQKIFDITKAAMNAVRYFKHVVVISEKFLVKCRNEYKISGLYVIDSILRQARKQYKHKDVFAPRFAINLKNTFINVLSCNVNERLKAVRVINLWLANKIFDSDVIEPLLQHCRATGLEVDLEKVELLVKGDKANMSIYGAEALLYDSCTAKKTQNFYSKPNKIPAAPKTPPLELRPNTPPHEDSNFEQELFNDRNLTEKDVLLLLENHDLQLAKLISTNKEIFDKVVKIFNERVTEKFEIERRRQGNIKNLLSREFDYSDEEDDEDPRLKTENSFQLLSKENFLCTAKSLLLDGSLSYELRQLYDEFTKNCNSKTPLLNSMAASLHEMQHNTLLHQNFLSSRYDTHPVGVPPPVMPSLPNISSFTSNISSQNLNIFLPNETSSSFEHTKTEQKLNAFKNDKNLKKRQKSRSYDRHEAEELHGRDRYDRGSSSKERSSLRKQRRSRSPSHRDKSDYSSKERREHRDRDHSVKSKVYDKESGKERTEVEEKEKERRKNGLPPRAKDSHVIIASRTLWFGRIPINCTENNICEAVKEAGVPEKINIVAPRACAYVTMKDRRAAYKIKDRMEKNLLIHKKNIKLSWATIQGLKDNEHLMDYWDMDRGIAQIPFSKLPENLDSLLEGAYLDVDTLPFHLKPLYDSKGLKNRVVDNQSLPTPQTLQSLTIVSQPNAQVTLLSNSVNSGALFSANLTPKNLFPFQQQMGIPPPFLSIINNTTNAGLSATTAVNNQQQKQLAAPEMTAFATAFPSLGSTSNVAASFPPFGVVPSNTNPAAAVAAAAFFNTAPPQHFSIPATNNLNSNLSTNNTQQPVMTSMFNNTMSEENSNQFSGVGFSNHFKTNKSVRGTYYNNNTNNNNNRGARFAQRGGNGRGAFRGNRGVYRGRGNYNGGKERFENNTFNQSNLTSEGYMEKDYNNLNENNGLNGKKNYNEYFNRDNRRSSQFNSNRGHVRDNYNTIYPYVQDEKNFNKNREKKEGDLQRKVLISPNKKLPNNNSNQGFFERSNAVQSNLAMSEIEQQNNSFSDNLNIRQTEDLQKESCNPSILSNRTTGISTFASTAADAVPVMENEKLNFLNISSISIPSLSAATISNLRKIITSNSLKTEENANYSTLNVNMEDSDEYDDNDDEYFGSFGQKRAEAADSTHSNKCHQNSLQGMDEEVSSTTFHDESEQHLLSMSAETNNINKEQTRLDQKVDSSSTNIDKKFY